jgi:hypothetical protein
MSGIDWQRELAIAARVGLCFAVCLFVACAVVGFGVVVWELGGRV